MKRISIAVATMLAGMIGAQAAEPVVGSWTTQKGETANISSCGGSYCIVISSGKFKGKQIGKFDGSGGSYSGEITDPESDKTYTGSAEVTGASMKLTGCALKIFCKSQTWKKQ